MEGKFKTKPYLHQFDCLNRFGKRDYFALTSEMGTGKTWIIINNIADLWAEGECDSALVLAPNGVHTNWVMIELPKHMPDWCNYRVAAWFSAPKRQEVAALDALHKPDGKGQLRILTMNHEALQTKRGMEFAKRFCATSGKLMIVADESDAFKNPSSIRTKNLMALKRYSTKRRIMTGTPVDQAPFDLFSQYSFLDEFLLGTTSYYAFKSEYSEILHDGHPLLEAIKKKLAKKGGANRRAPQIVARDSEGQPKYRNLDRLHKLIAPHTFRVLKKDCLDLPEKIYKNVFFDMTKEQRAAYQKAKNELRLTLAGEDTPFNRLAAAVKLSQITSGYYLHPNADEPVRIPGGSPKLDAMAARVAAAIQGGEKVIVWARYRVEIEDIVQRLREDGIACVQYHGGTKRGDRTKAIEEFERGSAQVFVGNQQAGGTGITLVAASCVIYFSNDFRLRNRRQSEDRSHRIGQKRAVVYYNLAARGTIDESVIRVLARKAEVADAVVDGKLEDCALWG